MTIDQSTSQIPRHPGSRRAWVIFQLRIRGSSLAAIAEKNNVSNQAVSNALLVPSSHLEQAIADELAIDVKVLFPERFDAAGNRLSYTRAPERTTPPRRRNLKRTSA